MSVSAISGAVSDAVSRVKEQVATRKAAQSSKTNVADTSSESAAQKDSVTLSDSASRLISEGETKKSSVTANARKAYSRSADVDALARTIVGDEGDLSDVIVAKGTGSADTIKVTAGKNGGVKVTINGKTKSYTAEQAEKLIIDASGGNDKITVDSKVTADLHITGGKGDDVIKGGSGHDTITDNYGRNYISGGAGDDRITAGGFDFDSSKKYSAPSYAKKGSALEKKWSSGNYIEGGSGSDYIEGGKGRDVVRGGAGNDTIYGMSGSDKLYGDVGNDYIDGGKGNDSIYGGKGNDDLFGGLGNDKISGGDGKDVIAGGKGKDTINSGAGKDKITYDSSDSVTKDSGDSKTKLESIEIPSNFTINGDDQFSERVSCDLETLASIKTGQKMLNSIAKTGKNVEFNYTSEGNYCAYYTSGIKNADGTANTGSDSFVYYNPANITLSHNSEGDWRQRPSIIGMYHEMCHSYNAATGTLDSNYYTYEGKNSTQADGGTKGAEFQAVGIDNGKVVQNPSGLSENSLRSFLNQPNRPRY